MRGQGWCSCQRLARCVCVCRVHGNTRGEVGAARRTHSPRVLESRGLTSACESSAPAGLWLWQGSAPGCRCSPLRTAAAVSCPGTAWHGTARHGRAPLFTPLAGEFAPGRLQRETAGNTSLFLMVQEFLATGAASQRGPTRAAWPRLVEEPPEAPTRPHQARLCPHTPVPAASLLRAPFPLGLCSCFFVTPFS